MDRLTAGPGGGLRLPTLFLCLFNTVVAIYLSYVVLLPLAFRFADNLTTSQGAGELSASELAAAEYTQFLGTPEQECNIELNTDFDGFAVRWGLDFLKETAGDCCQACLESARGERDGVTALAPENIIPLKYENGTEVPAEQRLLRCNTWVYCPQPKGCWSPDIYDHKHKECWLKYSEQPQVNYKGKYPDSFRKIHETAPELVDWAGGRVSAQ